MVAGKVRLQHNREKLDVTRGTLNATNQIPGAVLIVCFRLAGIGSAGEGLHGFIARKSKCLRGQAADTGAWDASRQRL